MSFRDNVVETQNVRSCGSTASCEFNPNSSLWRARRSVCDAKGWENVGVVYWSIDEPINSQIAAQTWWKHGIGAWKWGGRLDYSLIIRYLWLSRCVCGRHQNNNIHQVAPMVGGPRALQTTLLLHKTKEMTEIQELLERKRSAFLKRMEECKQKRGELRLKVCRASWITNLPIPTTVFLPSIN